MQLGQRRLGRLRIEFGDVADYETREARAAFTNTGTGPLQVTNVAPTCGCTTTALKQKLFAPGEGSEIELTFKPKGSGNQTKLVKVHTNDSINPVHTIMIKAKVSASVSANPKSLAFGEVDLGHAGLGVRLRIVHKLVRLEDCVRGGVADALRYTR